MKRIYLLKYAIPLQILRKLQDMEGIDKIESRYCVLNETAFENKEIHYLLGEKILVVEGENFKDVTNQINSI